MFNLVGNELYKLFKAKSIYIIVCILLASILLNGFGNMKIAHHTKTSKDWKQELINSNEKIELQTNLAKEDLLKGNIDYKKNDYYIKKNFPPINETTSLGLAQQAGESMILLQVLILIIASSIVSKEYTEGTYKALFTRSATRNTILASKFIAILVLIILGQLIIFLGTYLVNSFIFGFGVPTLKTIYIYNTHLVESNIFIDSLRTYGLTFLKMTAYASLAFMLSTLTRANDAAIAISIIASTIGSAFVIFLSKYEWVKYLLPANTDLNGYFENTVLLQDVTLPFSISMIFIYIAAFLLITFYVCNKRDLTK